jgi:hypothetical protein
VIAIRIERFDQWHWRRAMFTAMSRWRTARPAFLRLLGQGHRDRTQT